jgi:HlyD family secretion protein
MVAAAAAVAVASWLAWARWHRAPEVKVQTARVDRGRIVARVTATGTLSALVTVNVSSQVSGRIASIAVDFNSPVKKGDVLAKIDPRLFEAALEQARANVAAAHGDVASAVARARDADLQYRRAQQLADQKLIAPAERDTARANAEAATAAVAATRGRLAQASAAAHQASVNLGYTTITSPIDGIVVARNIDVGATVAASLQAPTLFVLAQDLRKMQVDTSVAEADIGKLASGMPAEFRVDAYPGRRFAGTVRQIRNAPQTVQNVVTYDAVIDVDNPTLELKPGMTANVTFIVADKPDVLRVPNAALRFRPSPGVIGKMARGVQAAPAEPTPTPPSAKGAGEESRWRNVWAVRDGRALSIPILPGISDGTVSELLEGDLHEGEAVITEAHVPGAQPTAQPGGNPMRRMF